MHDCIEGTTSYIAVLVKLIGSTGHFHMRGPTPCTYLQFRGIPFLWTHQSRIPPPAPNCEITEAKNVQLANRVTTTRYFDSRSEIRWRFVDSAAPAKKGIHTNWCNSRLAIGREGYCATAIFRRNPILKPAGKANPQMFRASSDMSRCRLLSKPSFEAGAVRSGIVNI